MQRNPNSKTIEGVLEQAIHKAGCISDANAGDFSKVNSDKASWKALHNLGLADGASLKFS